MSVLPPTGRPRYRFAAVSALACWACLHAVPSFAQESRRFEGDLRHLAIDDFGSAARKPTGRIVPVLDLGNGEHRMLDDPHGLLAGEVSGRAILQGRATANQIVVDEVIDVVPTPEERIITFPGGELGSQSTLVVLFNYADRPNQPFTVADVQGSVLDNADSADKFLRTTSYGQTWLDPTFLDWHTLPGDAADYANAPLDSLEDALEMLDPEIDLTRFTRLVFVFESRPPDQLAIGIGSINRFYFFDPDDGRSFLASVAWIFDDRPFVIAHELGHNLGLWHASSVACIPHNLQDPEHGGGDGCADSWSEYGDVDDTMGNTGYRHFSVRGRSQIGWIPLDQIPIATSAGEYLLRQTELVSAGVKGLRVPIGRDDFGSDVWYWLEYRKGLGDFGGTASGGDVVQVRTYRAYSWRDDADGVPQLSLNGVRLLTEGFANVDIGKPFHDPFRGVDIELLEKLGAGAEAEARIRVTRSGIRFEPPETLDFGLAPPFGFELAVEVRNTSSATRHLGAVSLEGRNAPSWSITNDGCTAHDLGAGQSCPLGLRFSPVTPRTNFATLVVETDDALRPHATASLTGWGDVNPVDTDGNGTRDALTDGLLLVRYLFGFRGSALIAGALGPNCGRCTPAAIESWLAHPPSELDIDGNGSIDALTDGLLVLRWLMGMRGLAVAEGAVDLGGCTRCKAADIINYLLLLTQ